MKDDKYKVVERATVPEKAEKPLTDRQRLYQIFLNLPDNKAIEIKCNSWSEMKDQQKLLQGMSHQLKQQAGCKIETNIVEEALSPQRQAAYEKSESPGLFKRSITIYAWKEPR